MFYEIPSKQNAFKMLAMHRIDGQHTMDIPPISNFTIACHMKKTKQNMKYAEIIECFVFTIKVMNFSVTVIIYKY